jgi:UDP:flavonoid glycosyltransferase YjiC (YdhE family)
MAVPMAVIVICAPALAGEIGLTRTLARGLQAAGHRVVYVGFPRAVPLVRAAGFDCVPVFTEWPIDHAAPAPSSSSSSLSSSSSSSPPPTSASGWRPRLRAAVARWQAARERARRLDARLGALLAADSNTFLDTLREIRPDLVLISSCVFENLLWAVLSIGAGYRTAYLTNNFDRSANADVPPVSSGRLPATSAIGRAMTWLAWQSHLSRREAAGRLRAALGLSANWRGRIDAFMERFDLSRSQIDTRRVMPAFRLPELVPFPREFDFGAMPPDSYHYVGPCVDLDPPDIPFDWTALDRHPTRPLIVCALGNLHHVARRQRERLLLAVIDAACASARPATWVVATGDSLVARSRSQQPALPPHVLLAGRIPQVRLLARAALMITHGGSNSVRECLHFGVPMLVVPRWFDQYGVGARVRAHGLGLVSDPRRVTAARVARQVDQILDDPAYAERAAQMRRRAQAYAQADLALRLIESWTRGDHSSPRR